MQSAHRNDLKKMLGDESTDVYLKIKTLWHKLLVLKQVESDQKEGWPTAVLYVIQRM